LTSSYNCRGAAPGRCAESFPPGTDTSPEQRTRPIANGPGRVRMMTVPQTIDRQTFLEHVLESGLLTAQQLEDHVAQLPETDRGRVVARTLVEKGLLTRFQAERLLAGRTDG